MNRSTRWLGLALFLAFLSAGCGKNTPAEAGHDEDEHDHAAAPAASVSLSPEAAAAVGLAVEPAVLRPLVRRISAAGTLEFNARRLRHLTARTAGRVERVAAVAGDRVGEGQVLAEIYSPDYLALQAEYIQAVERARRLSGKAEEAAAAKAVLEGVGRRLLVAGADSEEIEALAASLSVKPFLAVRASLAGTIISGPVVPGDHVEVGDGLFRLADLTTLWARIRVFEKDLAVLRPGGEAVLRTQAYPDREFRGRILLVGDVVDETTRTIEVRAEVPNPGNRLKAGMYVEASLAVEGERTVLAVPAAALQEIGGRAVVFVRAAEGTFLRRDVETGERWAGFVEILGGVAEGENVVAAGSFFLKSEILKASLRDEHGHD
ncbi:MAG: efflux RND transporter periplasmic adaptor subunit [Candidatus Aminicenantes bacterium]|nr:efflux RND transporter periplasmic adaptor subunit [Candidatus Aminicenantes bacterium]